MFETYFELLLKANETMNLTRITDIETAKRDHFDDSIKPLSFIQIPQGASVLDLGTGGGFPAVPLAIARPDLKITAVDSTAKKVEFVKSAVAAVGIPNITCICGRAEELGRDAKHREKYDYVFSRAVAKLNILLELCAPLCRKGIVAYKGMKAQEELLEAASAIKTLCLSPTAFTYDTKSILFFEKIKKCDTTFPRLYRIILKKPL